MPQRQGDVRFDLKIEQRHIDKATPKNLFGDPISLALKEATESDWAMAGWGYATTEKNGAKVRWILAPFSQISAFLSRFDRGLFVSPITIHVELEEVVEAKQFHGKPRFYRKDNETRRIRPDGTM